MTSTKIKIGGYAESTVRAYWDFYAEGDMPAIDEEDADIKVLASAYDPKSSTIAITKDTAAAIRCALCTLSNTEDETYERERRKPAELCDVEIRDAARHAARGLSGLHSRVCALT